MLHCSARWSTRVALTATAAALAFCAPAWAASSAASMASDSASTSVGSLSTSVENSSKSSSKGKETTAGIYTVIDMAEAPAPTGAGATAGESTMAMTRLRLQAVPGMGAEGEFFLTVPTVAVQHGGLATGQRVAANARPYGLEFARADNQRAFFLAMNDEWMRELRTKAVSL